MVATNALDAGRRSPGRRESEGAAALSDKMPRLVLEARRVSSLLAHGLHKRRKLLVPRAARRARGSCCEVDRSYRLRSTSQSITC